MSQSFHSQQAQGPSTLARFQLAKFSYTTNSVNHRGPLTWNHVFGNGNLIGTFEKYMSYLPGRILFRVLDNVETIEEICITDLIREFEGQINFGQDTLRRPAFAVVVKLPCLAVKYPRGPGYIRRFQIKFSSDQDFYSALAILSEINCPFSTSNTNSVRSMSRPATALPSFGHIGPGSGIQHYPSTATEISTSNSSMHLPFRSSSITTNTSIGTPTSSMPPPCRSSSIVHSTPPGILPKLGRGQDDKLTFGGSNRHALFIYTVQLRNSMWHKSAPFGDQPSINIPPTSTNSDLGGTGGTKRPSTFMGFTGYHDVDLELPPKRELPWTKPVAKKSRPSPKEAEKAEASKKSITEDTSPKRRPSASLPQSPREKIVVLRTLKSAKGPKDVQGTSAQTTSPTSNPNQPPNQPTSTPSPTETTALPSTAYKIPVDSKSEYLPTVADLASYITATTEVRTARLEGWLCAHIGDDNFLQLCEDVEGVWQRVAFGR
ncbi:hypothetical protein BDV06DRAFT_221019 [Aspergillus oleicola]